MANKHSKEVWQYSCKPCAFCGCSFCPMSARSKYCSLECICLSGIHVRASDECWEWVKSVSTTKKPWLRMCGYPSVQFQDGNHRPHRVIWRMVNGPIPEGFCILHRCDNPKCCNPNHLFLGTIADNNRDCERKRRRTRVPGERNGLAKLTDEQVLAIRSSSLNVHTLAFRYGVHFSTIYRIRNRERWRHL